jgi:O-methyltransferase
MSDKTIASALRIPSVFHGLQQMPETVGVLRTLVANAVGVDEPDSLWFIADNLITFGHTHGFLTDPRFIAAVNSEHPAHDELSIIWRTHTLCWAAESCLGVAGDYVECGCYRGYSMAVVLRYLAGLPGRHCYLYDLFNPTEGGGEGNRLAAHAPDLFEQVQVRFSALDNVSVIRGKVPQVLSETTPPRIAFLHVDMNNSEAELGALEMLFDRISPGGMIVFDDYSRPGYRAQKDAADTFLRQRSLAVLELPTRQGLAIKH